MIAYINKENYYLGCYSDENDLSLYQDDIENDVYYIQIDNIPEYDDMEKAVCYRAVKNETNKYSWEFDEEAYNNRPRAEPIKTTEDKLEEIDTAISDLQQMYFELLMEV